jgi:hypothetical protein
VGKGSTAARVLGPCCARQAAKQSKGCAANKAVGIGEAKECVPAFYAKFNGEPKTDLPLLRNLCFARSLENARSGPLLLAAHLCCATFGPEASYLNRFSAF